MPRTKGNFRHKRKKLNETLIVTAGKMAEKGNFDITICKALNVTTTTWYRWMKHGEQILEGKEPDIEYTEEMKKLLCDFYYTIKKAQGVAESQLLGYIEKEASTGTWQAAAWILERKYRQRWAKEVPQGDGESEAFDKFLDGIDDIAEKAEKDYQEQD